MDSVINVANLTLMQHITHTLHHFIQVTCVTIKQTKANLMFVKCTLNTHQALTEYLMLLLH